MFSIFKNSKKKTPQKQTLDTNINIEQNSNKILKKALFKTITNIKSIIPQKKEKIEFEIIEEILIESDINYDLIEEIMYKLPKMISKDVLKNRLSKIFEYQNNTNINENNNENIKIIEKNKDTPFINLIIGVNGAGKTTSIAKLANIYKNQNETILLGAGDTFRAGAIIQLEKWAKILEIPIIKTQQGHDPSAVAYDTIKSAIAKNIKNVIIDTAGRLQTQQNLNNELIKIVKTCKKAHKNAPHRKILILDGTSGNSSIKQAKIFHDLINIDGIIITKLDGTSKGGAIFSIAKELQIPILYIGIGENKEDIIPFCSISFIDNLLNEIYS